MNQLYLKFHILLFCCLGIATEIFAQQHVFRGKVVNLATQEEVPFAHIYFPDLDKGAIAGLKGNFELTLPNNIQAGTPVIFSCMGFKTVYMVWSPALGVVKVELTEEFLELDGVEIKPEDPTELIREAGRRILENYGTDSAFLQGYFKNFTLLDGKNLRYTEAFIDLIKPPYAMHNEQQDLVSDSIHVREVRTKPSEFDDWKIMLLTPWELNSYLLLNRDLARDFTSNWQMREFVSSYTYELEDPVILDGRPTYKIRIFPIKKKKYGVWLGHIYLDQETLAFVKVDFRSSPKLFKDLTNEFGYQVVTNLYRFHYNEGEWREVIQYRYKDGKWIFDEVNSSKHFVVTSKKRGMDHVPLVQTLHYKTEYESGMPKGQDIVFLPHDVGQANSYFEKNYRADFWRDFDSSRGVEMDEKMYGFKSPEMETKPYVFSKFDTLKGTLTPIRTAFDVEFYHLDVEVFTEEELITGSSLVRFRVIEPKDRIQLDLYSKMDIDSIVHRSQSLSFSREHDAVYIDFPEVLKVESTEEVHVYFRGRPLDYDPMTPMYASFLWIKDEEGNPFIQAICQGYGASGWWPNKDHLSDEPDSARISVTFPSDLKAISNGRKIETLSLGNGKTRSTWTVSYPINNYNMILNIGNYETVTKLVSSLEGELDVEYHFLKGHQEITEVKSDFIVPVLETYEKYFGAYPFPRDGIKFLETPHPMEHQSAVALGTEFFRQEEKDWSKFTDEDFEKSWIPSQILLHEFAHEWWGNSVSCGDNAELWIHEAFATYSEVLFIEDRFGYESGQIYINSIWPKEGENSPIIGKFGVNHVHYDLWSMYDKGAHFLNSIRKIVANDGVWFAFLKEIQSKFKYQVIDTSDVLNLLNERSGKDFTLFFDYYLNEVSLPKLEYFLEQTEGGFYANYRLNIDLGPLTIPVIYSLKNGEKELLFPTTTWQKILVTEGEMEDFQVDEKSFLLEFARVGNSVTN
ncbi:M1 family aminopeptidase [Algoriphagus resistens]|uniref:M1 family aminopeptidase n=1 Tax=Algoriphagus resistens TaxID=1750590 RepID=UPI0007168D3A|nr:M1 family aminopeptidase [Algoriphagus resistens]